MTRIGLISDTHGHLDARIIKHLMECDEIWHAGDVGDISVTDRLEKIKPVKAVYGNIDGQEVRKVHPKIQDFMCEGVKVLITHIGGYPGKYSPETRGEIQKRKPKLFICGHSHILKVMYDKKYQMLHMNPGACGKIGFHKVRTLLRFKIDGSEIKDLEAVELGKRV